MDRLGRGKQSIAVDLKKKEGIEIVKKLCSTADVLVEPFRKGNNMYLYEYRRWLSYRANNKRKVHILEI